MLNNKNKSRNYWKTTLIVPLIIGFIYSCNQKTETRIKEIVQNDFKIDNGQFHNEDYYKKSLKNSDYQEFSLPIRNGEKLNIVSEFGMRVHPVLKTKKMHKGIDLKAKTGTPVFATIAGEVIFAGKEGGYGNLVKIKNNNGYETRFGQLQDINVTVGQQITFKNQIGTVGSTGMATGPHLHYELLFNNKHINPKASLGLLPQYHILKYDSDITINETVRLFNASQKEARINIHDVIRDENNFITNLTFSSKFREQDRYIKDFSISLEKMKFTKAFSFHYEPYKRGVVLEFTDGNMMLITKDGGQILGIESNNKKSKLGKNPLHIINGKKVTQKSLKGKMVSCNGSIKTLAPKEAIKKYGEIAKDGALIFQGESKLIKQSE